MTPVEIAIETTLRKWAPEFIANRERLAREKLGKASGEGVESFAHEVIKSSISDMYEVVIAFNDYLRYADMRKRWTRQPPIEELEQFIRDKGIGGFIQKYRKKYTYIPAEQAKLVNKIAWAMAITIKKREGLKRKRVRWYAKAYNEDLSTLNERLLDALSRETLSNLKSSLSTV